MLQLLFDFMTGLIEAGWLVRRKKLRLDLSKLRLPRAARLRRGRMPVMARLKHS